MIAIFREDKLEAEGLKKIADETKVEFTLLSDLGSKQTKRYSPGKRKFDNYVIGPDGKIKAIIDGTLRVRATAKQIFETLDKITE